jgi:uncharacterized short protein YbdD (DUF466 family)
MRAGTDVRPGAGWRWLVYWTREFFGEHDYARYVADWNARHAAAFDPPGVTPGHRLLTAGEFFSERLGIRYGGGVNRCC